ncbi:MAG TPA: hypothetical protein VFT54_08295 [Acidimicrobiia bacterium]|nr:hypothetical protein [Acidimicrobiia bacterium]
MDRRLLPIACSLEGNQARQRWLDWGAVIADRLSEERSPLELRVRFRDDESVRVELNRLVAAERECCGFVAWDLSDLDGELVLSVTGEPTGVAAIDEAFRLSR